MFSRFFKPKTEVVALPQPSLPEGVTVWAIGDVHGRLDLLKPLVAAVIADAKATEGDQKVVIFLGDYIDRGPESRGVISFLADLPADAGIEWRFLLGNHEQTMLDFLEKPSVGPQWCEYGGDATLVSFNLRPPDIKHRPEPWVHLAAELSHRLTARERRFLGTLEYSVEIGGYFFSHAGARPGLALDKQSPSDLLWIRRSFLDHDAPFERIVVHGHTPAARIHADHRRIGIDTKAYQSGVLTALRLHGSERSALQAIAVHRVGPKGALFAGVDIVSEAVPTSEATGQPGFT